MTSEVMRHFPCKYAFLGLCAAVSLASCAPMGSSSLEQRVEAQDMQLRQMQPQQADTWNEVQAMREEINQLKGQIAQMRGGAVPAGAAVSGTPAVTQPAQSAQPPADDALGRPIAVVQEPVTGIQPGRSPDSSAYGGTSAAPAAVQENSYGLPPEPQVVEAKAPTESTWGQADPKPEPVAAPPKDLAAALYEAGMNDFNARKYQAAERSFRDFLKNYAGNAQAASAQYYLGECLFSRNQFPQAALEYDAVIKKYPKSSSVPGAYLKQAICFSKMKQPEAARMQMQAVISKFPKSAEAARARTFLKTNK